MSVGIVDATVMAACDLMRFYRFVQPSTGIASSDGPSRDRLSLRSSQAMKVVQFINQEGESNAKSKAFCRSGELGYVHAIGATPGGGGEACAARRRERNRVPAAGSKELE